MKTFSIFLPPSWIFGMALIGTPFLQIISRTSPEKTLQSTVVSKTTQDTHSRVRPYWMPSFWSLDQSWSSWIKTGANIELNLCPSYRTLASFIPSISVLIPLLRHFFDNIKFVISKKCLFFEKKGQIWKIIIASIERKKSPYPAIIFKQKTENRFINWVLKRLIIIPFIIIILS